MRLLLVAAERREFAGILARATSPQPAPYAVQWARTARLAVHQVLLAANGAGAKRAAEAVDAVAGRFRPEAVISTGFCGALDLSFGVGDIVVGNAVSSDEGDWPAWPVTSDVPAHTGLIRSIGHVAQTAEEKTRLSLSGACAVEMEAAGVAARATALGLAFCCIKAVTDLAAESLVNDFNAALRTDGHFDTISLLRGTLRHPATRLPELLRLRDRCARAARALGDFLVDCRF